MPFIDVSGFEDFNLRVWNIAEPESFFIAESGVADLSQLTNYRHPQARLQWLASRMLLMKFLGAEKYSNLNKNERGKMILEGSHLSVSISHSDSYVAVAFSNKQFGIDIQKFTDKIPMLCAKFIPEEILTSIKDSNNFDKICHVHWGTKEALFKAHTTGGLDYRKNLILEWDNIYSCKGSSFKSTIIKNEESKSFFSSYAEIDKDFLLCVVNEY